MSYGDKCFVRGIYCKAVAFLCYVQCAASAMRAQDYAGYSALAFILIAITFGLAGVILSALGSEHIAYAAHGSAK